MQAFGIPRLDAGAQGIHLVWSWPDVLPLSEHGYDVQRIELAEERMTARCETIDGPIIDVLNVSSEYPAPLGPLRRLRPRAFPPIDDPTLTGPVKPPAEIHAAAFVLAGDFGAGLGFVPNQEPLATQSSSAAQPFQPATSFTAPMVPAGSLVEYIQELTTPVPRATVKPVAQFAFAIALYQGNAVAVALAAPGTPPLLDLRAPMIDTIVVYVRELKTMEICAYDRARTMTSTDPWLNAPYIAKNLTLPIHETDPLLVTPAQEFAKAISRTALPTATPQADFQALTATLRGPAASTLGRSGERTLLLRTDAAQSFVEMPFEAQLSLLAVHPELRRALGFGFIDRTAVTGRTYVYRVTGHFRAEDLFDDVYDVHLVPSSTVLPAAFSIRGLELRFQTPVKVVLDPAPPATALRAVSRRGIRIDTTGYDASWFPHTFTAWSAIVDFPNPVTKVVLEVAPGHTFTYAAGLPWLFSAGATPLGPGPRVELTFASPVMQLRLAGTGTLYAIRIPAAGASAAAGASGAADVYAYTPPITMAAQPLPAPPTVLSIYGLQQPPEILTGPIGEATPVQPRPPPGFKLNWLPAVSGGITTWPADLTAAPPLEALAYVINHRLVTPATSGPPTYGPWGAIQPGDNLTLGSNDTAAPQSRLEYGCDLDEEYPRVRPRALGDGFAMHLSDIFGENDPATGTVVRPAQPFGSYHQYEIGAMDAVGRVSATPTLSNVARLEKHTPPPPPGGYIPPHGSGPIPAPVDAQGRLTRVPGPRARVIVRGANGLTAGDVAILGAHQNAIVLEWGWGADKRALDPDAKEFRVYATLPPDVVTATITAVTSAPPYWNVAVALSAGTQVPLVLNELAGGWIESDGYPFRVVQNDAGMTPSILVDKAAASAAQPVPGAVAFGRPLRAEHVRPATWPARVAVYPITAAENYLHVFYDRLTLDPSHPLDAIWVGVSAADAQSYVPDELTTGPNANRPGNECSIAACTASGRYHGRPVFSLPPPLGDVPEIVTDEPAGRRILVSLDLVALLGGALPAGTPVLLERCSSDDVISRVAVSGNSIVLTNPSGAPQTIVFANSADQAAVLATLNSSDPQQLANKYLLHLVVASSEAKAFFTPVSGETQQAGAVDDRLAPKPGRFLYFARKADALGHISQDGAILPVVVRVPSTALAATPQRRAMTTAPGSVSLTVAVPADPDTVAALLFAHVDGPAAVPANQTGAELLRIPNRRDLYPLGGIRLRLADGTLLAPALAKSLADADVVVETNGTRVATLTTTASHGAWATLWCYAVTRDGIPSYVCGPFGTGVS